MRAWVVSVLGLVLLVAAGCGDSKPRDETAAPKASADTPSADTPSADTPSADTPSADTLSAAAPSPAVPSPAAAVPAAGHSLSLPEAGLRLSLPVPISDPVDWMSKRTGKRMGQKYRMRAGEHDLQVRYQILSSLKGADAKQIAVVFERAEAGFSQAVKSTIASARDLRIAGLAARETVHSVPLPSARSYTVVLQLLAPELGALITAGVTRVGKKPDATLLRSLYDSIAVE